MEAGVGGGKRKKGKAEAEASSKCTFIRAGKASTSELHNSRCGGDEKHPKAAAGLYAEGQALGVI